MQGQGSKLEFQSKSQKRVSDRSFGLPAFIVGIVLSGFLGGAVRVLLSPIQVQNYIDRELSKSDQAFRFETEGARAVLSRGIWPKLGLEVHRLKISHRNSCVLNHQFVLENIFIPVEFTALLRGHTRVGRLESDQLLVQLKNKDCGLPLNPVAAPEVSSSKSLETSLVKVSEQKPKLRLAHYFATSWQKDREVLGKFVQALLIRNVDIQWPGQERPGLNLTQFSTQFQDLSQPLNIRFTLRLMEESNFLHTDLPMDSSVVVDQGQIQVKSIGKIREGELRLEGSIRTDTEEFISSAQALNIPIHHVSENILRARGLTSSRGPGKAPPLQTWLNCEAKLNGFLWDSPKSGLKLSLCRLDGQNGKINIGEAEFRPFLRPLDFESFHVDFKDLDVAGLLSQFGREGATGILSRQGFISGRLDLKAKNHLQFRGQVAGLEFIFSNQSILSKQLVSELDLALHYENGRISGLIDRVDLKGGQFKGLASFNMGDSFSEALFQIKVDELSFDPSIEELMLGGQAEPISIYGQGKFQGGQLVFWDGVFGSKKVQGKDWLVEEFKLRGQFAEEIFSGKAQARTASLSKGHLYFELFRRLFIESKESAEALLLNQISGQVRISQSGGSWEKLNARDRMGQISFASAGGWQSGEFKSWIDVDIGKFKALRWNLIGSPKNFRLEPSAEMLKTLKGAKGPLAVPSSWTQESEILVEKSTGS